MNKQIKTKLLLILGTILLITFVVVSCNNSKDEKSSVEVKTNVPPPPVKDSIDSANEAPGNDVKPQ